MTNARIELIELLKQIKTGKAEISFIKEIDPGALMKAHDYLMEAGTDENTLQEIKDQIKNASD